MTWRDGCVFPFKQAKVGTWDPWTTWDKLASGLELAASRSAHDQPKIHVNVLGFEHLGYHFFTRFNELTLKTGTDGIA
jgi:hypothetical protein